MARREEKMNFTIKKLEPSTMDDFLFFFDKIGFSDNKDWQGCYCHFYHFKGDRKDWGDRNGEANKNASIKLISSNKMTGFLVYDKDQPIGWCNANIKENFPALVSDSEINYVTNEKIASIVCFLIAPEYRRMGIARKLLNYIQETFKNENFDYLEAYPRRNVTSAAHNYKGPLPMYEKEEFKIFKEFKDYYIVRKKLN
jgi:ribosomal protein S18 acetylase RimI-like enzyme